MRFWSVHKFFQISIKYWSAKGFYNEKINEKNQHQKWWSTDWNVFHRNKWSKKWNLVCHFFELRVWNCEFDVSILNLSRFYECFYELMRIMKQWYDCCLTKKRMLMHQTKNRTWHWKRLFFAIMLKQRNYYWTYSQWSVSHLRWKMKNQHHQKH